MPPAKATTQAPANINAFPRTRYQGSKRKLAGAILAQLADLEYETVLDLFGGTGAMAYAFKCAGKAVTYNDVLAFNHQIGLALIENDTVRLTDAEAETICAGEQGVGHGDFIQRTFQGVYFTNEENRWLDAAVARIRGLACRFKRAIAWFAVFQAAMAKRPYNLFHRSNLYMRTAEVARSFGNKASWDRSFAEHFRAFTAEANAAIIDSGGRCRALCRDALDVDSPYDLVYIDTPYINRTGVGVDYREFYHFLEGMVRYDDWPEMIDYESKHRRLTRRKDPWSDPRKSHEMFRRLVDRFRNAILVVSYRNDGIPAIAEIADMLRAVKSRVRKIEGNRYQYALSTKRNTREALLIAV